MSSPPTMTVIFLRRKLEEAEDRQMRARGQFGAVVPKRVGQLLGVAIQAVRTLAGAPISPGSCLAVIAWHFLDVWGPPSRPKTSSQKIRQRDDWQCTVPGCSHSAVHAHHLVYLSQGGHRTEPGNQTGACAFHHKCIHDGRLEVYGTAPEGLTWLLGGKVFDGRPE